MAVLATPRELCERFVFVLLKRKWLAIISATLTFAVLVVGVYLVDPAYKATAKILVRRKVQQQVILFHDLETPVPTSVPINPAYNLMDLSTSRGVAESVVKRFGLHKPKEPTDFRGKFKKWLVDAAMSPVTLLEDWGILDKKPPSDLADAIEELIDDVQDVQVKADTEIVDLTMWGPTPELAAGIANAMAEILVEKTRDVTRTQAAEAYESTRLQLDLAETSLLDAEKQLTEFKLAQGVLSPENQRDLILKRLDDLRTQQSRTLADLREAQARVTEIRNQLEMQEPTLVSSTVEASNPVVESVETSSRELSGQLASLTATRGALDPEVKQLRNRIVDLESQLKDAPRMKEQSRTTVLNPIRQQLLQQLSTLSADVGALEAKSAQWKQELSEVNIEIDELTRNEAKLENLIRNKETHEERFSTLKTKLLELEVQQATASGEFDIRVIDPARVIENSEADYPDWEFVLIGASFFAIGLGLGLPFVREYLADTLDTPRDLESMTGAPVLCVVSRSRNRKHTRSQAPTEARHG